MSKQPPPGFPGRRLRSTKTMSKLSKSCALAFGKLSISPKVLQNTIRRRRRPQSQPFVGSREGHRRRGLPASDNDSERLLPHCDDVRGPPQRRRRRRQDGLPWANEFCPSLTRQALLSCPNPLGPDRGRGDPAASRPFTTRRAPQTNFQVRCP